MAARGLLESGRRPRKEAGLDSLDCEEWIHCFVLVRVLDRLKSLGMINEYIKLPRAQADGYLMSVIPNYVELIRDSVSDALEQLEPALIRKERQS
jgi:hypothetical protein